MAQPIYNHFSIRAAGANDLDAIVNLWQQLPGLTLRAEDSPATLQLALDDGKLNLYVAERESQIVGVIMMGTDGRRGHLYHLAVAECEQGLGLGRRLVEFALEELAAQGVSRTHVFVQSDNNDARRFWARLGWQQRTDLTVYSNIVTETSHAR